MATRWRFGLIGTLGYLAEDVSGSDVSGEE